MIFADHQTVSNNNRSLTWYLSCRTAVITLMLGGAAVFFIKGTLHTRLIPPLFFLIGLSYAEALVSALILKKIKKTDLFTQVQIVWDLLFVSILIVLTGGVESVFSFAYLLIIVPASFLLSRRLTIIAAASAVILFGGILNLQYFGFLEQFRLYRTVADGTFFSILFVHTVAFFLTAILSGTLAERWRKSEEQLHRKTIDYAELEKMNRTILAHISSGLMLINPVGKIRSFNRAASDITGLSLQEVYDREVGDFFPEFGHVFGADSLPQIRAEASFKAPGGNVLILGYATTPAKGRGGEFLGTLVTFQDLTQFKKIEEDLKRADRLAAIGRLAAGMAHEIRNPLASISGSIQMLMEDENVEEENRNLMGIVVKEAERLNGLLTNFLSFAKPRQPEKESLDIVGTLSDFKNMLMTDPRFDRIDVRLNVTEKPIRLDLDRGQFLQVLWDLAINASDAMSGVGVLIFAVETKDREVNMIVEDSGPGIDSSIEARIFEPFFSTKDHGTGLGLASVYSIIEMHEGKIYLGPGKQGGAKFTLTLPRGVQKENEK